MDNLVKNGKMRGGAGNLAWGQAFSHCNPLANGRTHFAQLGLREGFTIDGRKALKSETKVGELAAHKSEAFCRPVEIDEEDVHKNLGEKPIRIPIRNK